MLFPGQTLCGMRIGVVALIGASWVLIMLGYFAYQLPGGFIRSPWRLKASPIPRPAFNHHEQVAVGLMRDYRVLTSTRNHLGFLNKVDTKPAGTDIFNPTLIELPRGSQYDFLIIGRAPYSIEEVEGKNYTRNHQKAVFANLTYDKLGSPTLTSGEWVKDLLADFEEETGPAHHCKNEPNMDKYIGPEDMKISWTNRGEPLLIFTHQLDDENLCETMFIVDARAAVPELVAALGKHAEKLPSIRFDKPVMLRRTPPEGHEEDARYQRDKNWAISPTPFGDEEEVLFMIEPSQLFRFVDKDSDVEDVEATPESAVTEPYPLDEETKTTWHSKSKTCLHDVMRTDHRVHQSSPMLSVTLCEREASCAPSPNNTLMMGMVQLRRDPPGAPFTWYDHRIVAYEAVAPYNMVSVSRRLTYHGAIDGTYTWTGGMVYLSNQDSIPANKSHGYLDDEVWLSFGVGDRKAGWLDVQARDLLTDHYMCEGAPEGYLEKIDDWKLSH